LIHNQNLKNKNIPKVNNRFNSIFILNLSVFQLVINQSFSNNFTLLLIVMV